MASSRKICLVASKILRPIEIELEKMKLRKLNLNRREKELILGNFVAWGSIVTALTLAISLAPSIAAEEVQAGGAASDVM
tara:strand:+ start:13091 stop:13330 length:240 start_codon:yes stop_codon:yes gene_type:complete